jgi:hypothetical protein
MQNRFSSVVYDSAVCSLGYNGVYKPGAMSVLKYKIPTALKRSVKLLYSRSMELWAILGVSSLQGVSINMQSRPQEPFPLE